MALTTKDIDLDADFASLDKQQLGFYVSIGTKLLDVLVLSQG